MIFSFIQYLLSFATNITCDLSKVTKGILVANVVCDYNLVEEINWKYVFFFYYWYIGVWFQGAKKWAHVVSPRMPLTARIIKVNNLTRVWLHVPMKDVSNYSWFSGSIPFVPIISTKWLIWIICKLRCMYWQWWMGWTLLSSTRW